MSYTRETAKKDAIDRLSKLLKPGDTIYSVVRTVSRSGMSRTIDFYAFAPDKERGITTMYLSGYIALALGYSRTPQGALRVAGCGMDMCYDVVYHIGRLLFPNGFGLPCFGKINGRRPKTKEEAAKMSDCGSEFIGRNGDTSGWEADGGYAFRSEVL